MISPTHAQADEIASRIRQGLRERGDLKGKDHIVRRLVDLQWSPAQVKEAKEQGAEGVVLSRYAAYREDTQALAVGDLVRTTMGGKTKDGKHRLCNGQRYRIQGFTKAGDPILSNGWVVDRDWGGLVQRYVSTGQGAQGITEKRAIVVYGTPSLVATRQEGFYVPCSRISQELAVLTDSNAALREAIQRQESRKSALELMHRAAAAENIAAAATWQTSCYTCGGWRPSPGRRSGGRATGSEHRRGKGDRSCAITTNALLPAGSYIALRARRRQTGGGGDGRRRGVLPGLSFLRGLDARALAVEFRWLSGNSEWFSYSCLVSWRYNPSVGLLLKFTSGDGIAWC